MDRSNTTLFVAMRLRKWDDSFEASIPFQIKVDGGKGCVGFLAVYASREIAEQENPGYEVVVVQTPDATI